MLFTFLFFTKMNDNARFFFFFQAEDGIRDYKVTGVQTCALPISPGPAPPAPGRREPPAAGARSGAGGGRVLVGRRSALLDGPRLHRVLADAAARRELEGRARAEAGDGGPDAAEPHRQHPGRHPEDAEPE